MHSCGFDSIPSDLGVLELHRAVQRDGAGELEDTTFVVERISGGFSGGTLDSLRGQLDEMRRDPAKRKLSGDPYALSPDRDKEPDLGPEHLLVEGPQQLGGNRSLRGVPQQVQPLQRREHLLEGVDVGVDPIDAVEGERPLGGLRQPVAGVETGPRCSPADLVVQPEFPEQAPEIRVRHEDDVVEPIPGESPESLWSREAARRRGALEQGDTMPLFPESERQRHSEHTAADDRNLSHSSGLRSGVASRPARACSAMKRGTCSHGATRSFSPRAS